MAICSLKVIPTKDGNEQPASDQDDDEDESTPTVVAGKRKRAAKTSKAASVKKVKSVQLNDGAQAAIDAHVAKLKVSAGSRM